MTRRELRTRNEICQALGDKIDRATAILRDARRDALVADGGSNHRQALNAARNSIIDALTQLGDSDDEESLEKVGVFTVFD